MIWKQELDLPLKELGDQFEYKKWLARIKSMKFKRGWNSELWTRIFELMLEPLDPNLNAVLQLHSMKIKSHEIIQLLENELKSKDQVRSLVQLLKKASSLLIDKK